MSERAHINILMTGAGAPGAAGILKCLHSEPSFNVHCVDASEDAVGRWLNPSFEKIPFASEKNFIDALLKICEEKKIQVLMPLVTRELNRLAQHKKEFEAIGTKILVSDGDVLDIANNKGKLYQFLEWREIRVPTYRIVERIDQFKKAVDELGFPENRVCFKPCVSNGSRGFRILADDIDEHQLLFFEKPSNSFITLEKAIRILSSNPFPELLVTEFLPGEEYSVDCLANNGIPRLVVPRLRKKMINGISVQGEFIQNEEIIRHCSSIISELRLHGNIGIQVKKSASGKFLVLEINPRVQGTIVAALGAGVNLPVLAIKQELNIPITGDALNVRWGTKFFRYWNEVFY